MQSLTYQRLLSVPSSKDLDMLVKDYNSEIIMSDSVSVTQELRMTMDIVTTVFPISLSNHSSFPYVLSYKSTPKK